MVVWCSSDRSKRISLSSPECLPAGPECSKRWRGYMDLTVREMMISEVDLIINYFHRSAPEHLEMLGVDPTRLPRPDAWRRSALPVSGAGAKWPHQDVVRADGSRAIGRQAPNPPDLRHRVTGRTRLDRSGARTVSRLAPSAIAEPGEQPAARRAEVERGARNVGPAQVRPFPVDLGQARPDQARLA